MPKIELEKSIIDDLYEKAKNSIDKCTDTEMLLDNKLIETIFARNIAIYVNNNFKLDVNDFIIINATVNNNKLKISVGTVKKSINSDITLTYGII